MIFNLALCALAVLTCAACMALLLRAYRRVRRPLLLWSAICFVFLTLNNVFLFLDVVVLEQDLRAWRHAAALIGLVVMISGLIAERE